MEVAVDFKFVNSHGVVVGTAGSALEASARLRADDPLFAWHILLDDTGIEISQADLDVLCVAQELGNRRDI